MSPAAILVAGTIAAFVILAVVMTFVERRAWKVEQAAKAADYDSFDIHHNKGEWRDE